MTSPQISLAGKRVLVTAGGDGIGLEITRAFAAAGAKLVVCDIQPESLQRLAKELPEVHGCIADVSRETSEATRDRVIFTPTLVKRRPGPPVWIVGDLAHGDVVHDLLHLCGLDRVTSTRA